jgi:glycosyltransferase involved in cell wall biosynthesis
MRSQIPFDSLDYPACFDMPHRLTNVRSWHEHIPFAFAIMQMLRPKVFVELGTHRGDSYCTFCQVVQKLDLDTQCYAIDTWEGDTHAGQYDSSIYEELKAYHDPLYSRFSRLIRCAFDDALARFPEGSIDLLHIDGLHTYSAVRHDFESWLPKMSTKGVVLFHDTNVMDGDFGVWKLWKELALRFEGFEFGHGHGLGVLVVGNAAPEPIEQLVRCETDRAIAVAKFYSALGRSITLNEQIGDRDAVMTVRDQQIAVLSERMAERDSDVAALNRHVAALNRTVAERDDRAAGLESLVAQREAEIRELSATVANRETRLQTLLSSTSWRITSPMRIAAIMVRMLIRDRRALGPYLRSQVQRAGQRLRRMRPKTRSNKAKRDRASNVPPGNEDHDFGGGHIDVRKMPVNDAYERGRALLATGILNRFCYGETPLSGSNVEEEWRQSSGYYWLLRLCGDTDAEDTDAIVHLLSRMSPEAPRTHAGVGEIGGGPTASKFTAELLDEIERHLRQVSIPTGLSASSREPTFTIVTSFFHHIGYFKECADSVAALMQHSPDVPVEWIVINDDPRFTAESLTGVLEEGARNRVKVHSDGRNRGIANRLNEAIALASHEWILFLDCDDLIAVDALRVLSAYVRRFPFCRYMSSCMVDIDESGRVLRYRHRLQGPSRLPKDGMVAGHLKAVRRDLFQDIGLLDDSVDGCQDYEFALRTASQEPLLFVPDYLYFYRWHGTSQSASAAGRQTATADRVVARYVASYIESKLAQEPSVGHEPLAPAMTTNEGAEVNDALGLLANLETKGTGVGVIRTQGNRLELLSEAVESIASQDVTTEAVVVVHGDTAILEKVKASLASFADIAKVIHAPDVGRCRGYPLNVALRTLKEQERDYDFIFFLDDDDIVYPFFSRKMLEALKATEADVVYAASAKRVPWHAAETGYRPMPASCLVAGNFIPINSYVVRFSALRQCEFAFDESLEYLEDWDFLVRLYGQGSRFTGIEDTLSEFRITGDGNAAVKRNPDLWASCERRVRERIKFTCQSLGRWRLYHDLYSTRFLSRELVPRERQLLSETLAQISACGAGKGDIERDSDWRRQTKASL